MIRHLGRRTYQRNLVYLAWKNREERYDYKLSVCKSFFTKRKQISFPQCFVRIQKCGIIKLNIILNFLNIYKSIFGRHG